MQLRTVQYNEAPTLCNMTDELAAVLDSVNEAKRGRFAFVKSHVSGTAGKDGCEVPAISDFWFLAMPRYEVYQARRRAAIAAMDAPAVIEYMERKELDGYTVRNLAGFNAKLTEAGKLFSTLFENSKATVLLRIDGKDVTTFNQREAHHVSYAMSGKVKINLVTETDPTTKRQIPVFDADGHITAKSIMLPFYQIRRWYSQRPEYKRVNSAVDTIMRDTIERVALESLGLAEYKTLSLQKGNFQFVTLDSARIAGLVRDVQTAELDAAFAEVYREIGNLPAGPLTTLNMDAETPAEAEVSVSSQR